MQKLLFFFFPPGSLRSQPKRQLKIKVVAAYDIEMGKHNSQPLVTAISFRRLVSFWSDTTQQTHTLLDPACHTASLSSSKAPF